MKAGDFYQHFKGTEYYFCGIALPYEENKSMSFLKYLESEQVALDAHTPEGEEIKEINLYNHGSLMFIERDEPHVIYQSEKDYDTDRVWARKIDDFFGYKLNENGRVIQRFAKK